MDARMFEYYCSSIAVSLLSEKAVFGGWNLGRSDVIFGYFVGKPPTTLRTPTP
jgi:hypothetical protein